MIKEWSRTNPDMGDIKSHMLLDMEEIDEEEGYDLGIMWKKQYLTIGYQQSVREEEMDIIGTDTHLPMNNSLGG